MPVPNYRGLTEAQLLKIRDAAIEQETTGKVTIGLSVGGKNANSQITSTPAQRIEAASSELRRLNPDVYGTIDDRAIPDFQ